MRRSTFAAAVAGGLAVAFAGARAGRLLAQPPPPWPEWRFVAEGKAGAISGLAFLERSARGTTFLAVHDVKRKHPDPRLRLVTLAADGTPSAVVVAWPDPQDPTNDLEAVAAIPGHDREFLLAESGGRLFRVRLSKDGAAEIVGRGRSLEGEPPSDVEGFAVQALGGRLVAVVGCKGAGAKRPGVLAWGDLRLAADGGVSVDLAAGGREEIVVEWPNSTWLDAKGGPGTHHVSDLALASDGTLWGSADYDAGDDGPFLSAVYRLGRMRADEKGIAFDKEPVLRSSRRFPRKCEAIAFDGDAMVFGADDENDGGWILPP